MRRQDSYRQDSRNLSSVLRGHGAIMSQEPRITPDPLDLVSALPRLATNQSWHYRSVPEAPADCSRAAPIERPYRARSAPVSATVVDKWSLQVPSWLIAMSREPRTGQDVSPPSATSRGQSTCRNARRSLHQPLDRPGRDASRSPQPYGSRPHRPERHLSLQLQRVLAPHVQGESPGTVHAPRHERASKAAR
jgi:hypothetical protein